MSAAPRLFLTSMSSDASAENPTEMIEPLLPFIDGVIWVLHDVSPNAASARYLETVKGAGRVIHRSWPAGRHWHSMNETLFTGLIEEGDLVIWTDPLERPMPPFVSRIKGDIDRMMHESETDCICYYGKPFLFRYSERLEYRNTPHWSLTGFNKWIDWTRVERNERNVRFNVRPLKRKDPLHWVTHYARYYVEFPEGSNTCALGLDHFPPGDRNQQFAERETRRIEFRRLMRARNYPRTIAGLKMMLTETRDKTVLSHVKSEKILSDFYHFVHGRGAQLKDSHNPAHALPIE